MDDFFADPNWVDSIGKEYPWPIRNHRGHRLEQGKWLGYPKDDDGNFLKNADGSIVGPEYSHTLSGFDLYMVDGHIGKHLDCGVCYAPVGLHLTRAGYVRADTECEYPDGIPCKFFLEVPSGVLFVGNDFRGDGGNWNEDPDNEIESLGMEEYSKMVARERKAGKRERPHYYVNTSIGCVETTMWFAARKMAHAFVGNTCPGVYRITDDHYTIANGGYRMDGDEEIEISPVGDQVASICTDLWWYSIADKDEYLRHNPNPNMQWIEEVHVKPGVYQFDHHVHEEAFNRDDPKGCVFTDITWVKKCG